MFKFDGNELKLKVPFRMVIVGPSSSGKTSLTARIIRHRDEIFTKPPTTIILVYSEFQALYERLENEHGVILTRDLPDELPENGLLILDDLMLSLGKEIVSIFVKRSHHANCSVIYLSQTLFNGQVQRTISLNASYIVLLKNVRDKLSVKNLAIQLFPGKTSYLLDAFDRATREIWGYLLLDLDPRTPESLRLRTHIFPSERNTILYLKAK